jgi:hypothetical protein
MAVSEGIVEIDSENKHTTRGHDMYGNWILALLAALTRNHPMAEKSRGGLGRWFMNGQEQMAGLGLSPALSSL